MHFNKLFLIFVCWTIVIVITIIIIICIIASAVVVVAVVVVVVVVGLVIHGRKNGLGAMAKETKRGAFEMTVFEINLPHPQRYN